MKSSIPTRSKQSVPSLLNHLISSFSLKKSQFGQKISVSSDYKFCHNLIIVWWTTVLLQIKGM